MARFSTANLEEYVNDVIKEDLKAIETRMSIYNAEAQDYIELRNFIEALKTNFPDGNFKTQMPIGHKVFIEAKVPDTNSILVDIGLGYQLDFTLEEALTFCNFKIKVLTKSVERLRELSLDKRKEIKMTLMYIAEKEKLYEEKDD